MHATSTCRAPRAGYLVCAQCARSADDPAGAPEIRHPCQPDAGSRSFRQPRSGAALVSSPVTNRSRRAAPIVVRVQLRRSVSLAVLVASALAVPGPAPAVRPGGSQHYPSPASARTARRATAARSVACSWHYATATTAGASTRLPARRTPMAATSAVTSSGAAALIPRRGRPRRTARCRRTPPTASGCTPPSRGRGPQG